MVYPLDQISGHARIDINITQNTIAGHYTHTLGVGLTCDKADLTLAKLCTPVCICAHWFRFSLSAEFVDSFLCWLNV